MARDFQVVLGLPTGRSETGAKLRAKASPTPAELAEANRLDMDNLFYGSAQDLIQSVGWDVYMPQLRYQASYNIATALRPASGTLSWDKEAVTEMTRFPHAMVFSYGAYYYGDTKIKEDGTIGPNPSALSWRGLDGTPRTQDAISASEMETRLKQTLGWFISQGVKNPWIFVDEPPHYAVDINGNQRFGWSPTVEARVKKFIGAAVGAGWRVGVAIPGPSQLRFWYSRIKPTFWILGDGPDYMSSVSQLKSSEERWLYNTDEATGLCDRLTASNSSGVLEWTATNPTRQKPNFVMIARNKDGEAEWTPFGMAIRNEIASYTGGIAPTNPPVEVPKTLGQQVQEIQQWILNHEKRHKSLNI